MDSRLQQESNTEISPEVGKLVLVRIIRPRRLLHCGASGGVERVLKKVRPVNYVVQNPYAHSKEKQFHVNKLRRDIPRERFEFPKSPMEDNTEDSQD